PVKLGPQRVGQLPGARLVMGERPRGGVQARPIGGDEALPGALVAARASAGEREVLSAQGLKVLVDRGRFCIGVPCARAGIKRRRKLGLVQAKFDAAAAPVEARDCLRVRGAEFGQRPGRHHESAAPPGGWAVHRDIAEKETIKTGGRTEPAAVHSAARSSERYWIASLTCGAWIGPPPWRSAIVRATLRIRV